MANVVRMNKKDGVIRLNYGVFRYIVVNECVDKREIWVTNDEPPLFKGQLAKFCSRGSLLIFLQVTAKFGRRKPGDFFESRIKGLSVVKARFETNAFEGKTCFVVRNYPYSFLYA